MYVQQRDEYLEHVCEMAIRKVSIITIFGTLTNSTMKIDHYQLGKLLLCFFLIDYILFKPIIISVNITLRK